jgi:hypothetical protein
LDVGEFSPLLPARTLEDDVEENSEKGVLKPVTLAGLLLALGISP